MIRFLRIFCHPGLICFLNGALSAFAALPEATAPSAAPVKPPAVNHWTDAKGDFYRRSSAGHVTNYEETKVGNYALPDPLVTLSGIQVKDRETWEKQRRPEILELYRREIYGRVPARVPSVHFDLESTVSALGGKAVHKTIALSIGAGTNIQVVHLHLYVPADASGPVPVLLQLLFRDAPDFDHAPANALQTGLNERAPLSEIIARGYAYAVFRYTEVEPDGKDAPGPGVRALARSSASATDEGDSWGSISAWAWAASRVMDYFETDKAIDARRAALIGHSRLGKTVLWAGAQDERFALIFSSCAGEMGSSLARRDFGETVDDMAESFPTQFAPNFRKYIGAWNALPVDAHLLLALNAPRPVLITAGSADKWADPRGEFLAEVAASPVYRLLGKDGLGTTEFPPLDTPIARGSLAYHCHTGGHTITAGDWEVFLNFADRNLR